MGVRIGIDTGGTFTDLIGLDDATGELVVAKTPSTPREPVLALANALGASGVPPAAIDFLILGTTVATNALLQRQGAEVIFLTTAGFEDVPYIQRMNRTLPLFAELDEAQAAGRAPQLHRGRGAARLPRPRR